MHQSFLRAAAAGSPSEPSLIGPRRSIVADRRNAGNRWRLHASGPRVDVPHGLYHVIARGVERRDIFRTDRDRDALPNRLASVVEEEDRALLDLTTRPYMTMMRS